jgi:NADPH:quinone reductase-like Zn-dependent oxidoreductase
MKAFIRKAYGGPEVLQLGNAEKPSVEDGYILVKVMANSANPADWHILRGKPFSARFAFGLLKPKYHIPGSDFSGVVEAVGKNVRHLKAGDRVFGETLKGGAFARYVSVPVNACGLMPATAGFPEMAGVSIAGITALQALVHHGQLKKGETVLINGATGGVGHFAVQIAKAYGAHVTAVCSGRNMGFAKALGADQVIAYDKESIHRHGERYDLVIDAHGNLSYKDYKRMGRRGVMVGFTTMRHMISLLLKRSMGKFPLKQFTVKASTKDLEMLASLVEQGRVKVHIERTYSYRQIPEAITYIEAMRTRGKVVMLWEDEAG